jgi:DNA-binding CsgD family transcriptional regulator
MKKNMSTVAVFRAIAAFAASGAIVCLIAQEDSDAFEPATIPCAIAAILSLASAFTRPRPAHGEKLSLESFGLTRKEKAYVLEYLAGKQIKEIAIDNGVSASTVRTALSLAYRKLKLSGSAELFALGAYYRIE